MRIFLRIWVAFIVIRACLKQPELFLPLAGAAFLIWLGCWIYQRRRRDRRALAAHIPAPDDAAGILFIESEEPLPSDSRCITCRHPLARDVIYCVKCHTPHHRDCFRYVGACSVYACRSGLDRKAA